MKRTYIIVPIILCTIFSIVFFAKKMSTNSTNTNSQPKYNLIGEYYKIAPDYISKSISNVQIIDQPSLNIAKIKIDSQDTSKFIVTINSNLVIQNGKINKDILIPALIHEIGHQISINDIQIDLQNRSRNDKKDFYKLEEECKPKYYLQEGCSKIGSYLNNWFKLFWQDIWLDFQELQAVENGAKFNAAFTTFCDKYKDQFVNIGSCFNPEEDFAEMFKVFVMEDKLDNESIQISKKIDFFRNDIFLSQLKSDISVRLDNLEKKKLTQK
jgi:hypothetical protein